MSFWGQIGGAIIGGLFGKKGADKDAALTQALHDSANAATGRQMRRARRWQVNDNRRARRFAIDDARMLRKQSMLDQKQYFAKTRKFAERAGFNPLSVLGMLPQGQTASPGGGGVGAGAMGAPGGAGATMGNAYANAGMMLGQGLGQSIDLALENEQLAQSNAELNKAMETITLRPKIDGIYADRESFLSRAAATGGENARTTSDLGLRSDTGLRFGGGLDPADHSGPALDFSRPDDPIEEQPVPRDAGYMLVRDPSSGRYVQVPAVGGEIVDISQMPTLGFSIGNDRAKSWYEKQSQATRSEWNLRKFEDQSPNRYAFGRYMQRKKSTPMGYDFFGTY